MTDSPPLMNVTDAELDDLRSRLRNTRWPTAWPTEGWAAGTEPGELRRLVAYWADGYDWRTHEAAVNALPSHFADIDGTPVHYLRFDGESPGALPIVLTHGWPSSVLELAGLARRLATPSQFGGAAEDAFTVIVPSVPGFAFSPQRPVLDGLPTHEIWHRLLHDHLGFERYGAHGGDLGSGITSRLAAATPRRWRASTCWRSPTPPDTTRRASPRRSRCTSMPSPPGPPTRAATCTSSRPGR
ncbi:Epoxide hydrolase N terminus [Streptomyces sp. DvalAA-14]|uniref:epoxide hydrolase family protein n=1 Tax=unclassified Streptomyces TaxID=2593676 RepID=UPI00081B9B25|nr:MULTISPECIES: epoxide hydrolase [unclassified Streptomyces]SCE31404.1 Epoxide hydrolase N terminus [Streptomyces sp. DvalAA-14]